jgi:hypothetical protein
MKVNSAQLTQSARNSATHTAKLLVGGVVAAAGSESVHAAVVAWNSTPFTVSGNTNTAFIPIAGYSSYLHVNTANSSSSGGKFFPSVASINYSSGAGLSAELNFDDTVGPDIYIAATGNGGRGISDGSQYWGFSLPSGGTTLYGWVGATVSGVNSFTSEPTFDLTGYAYDDTGASIKVGALTSSVPEPSALTMALLAGSAAVWRRRRSLGVTAAA